MLKESIEILSLYLKSLDREYDNDCIILTEKIISDLSQAQDNMKILKTMVPCDVPDEIKEKLNSIN